MEPARQLVSRRLPELHQSNGMINPSISSEELSVQFMQEWRHFKQEVLETCQSLDLSGHVSITDAPEGERFVVGSELGLTGRFHQHVCDAVTKALSTTRLSHLRFGDIQALRPSYASRKVPDISLFAMLAGASLKPLLVGELKTFWTFPLENCSIDADPASLDPLEPHMGKFVDDCEQCVT
jgi:hypothetical protein